MPKTLKRSHQIGFTVAGIGLALVFFSCWYLEISPMDLLLSFPDFISFFTANFLPPNFSDWQEFLPSVLDTIFFAIVATYISTFFAMFFGLMMSELVNPFKPLRVVFRGIVSFFRNIPVMIWAQLTGICLWGRRTGRLNCPGHCDNWLSFPQLRGFDQ